MQTKHREAIFQHWRSAILREARDLASLNQVGERALRDPAVREDPVVEGMIRAEVDERRSEFTQAARSRDAAFAAGQPRKSAEPAFSPPPTPTPHEQIRLSFERLAQQFRQAAERDDEREARAVVDRMRAVQADHAEALPLAAMQPFEQRLIDLREREKKVREQIAELTRQAVGASREGDTTAVSQCLRQLSVIHAGRPALLDEHHLEQLRAEIIHASEEHDHRLAARQLVEREQTVAAEIKTLAAGVHAFHRATRRVEHGSEEYRRAEAEYRRVLREVGAHDNEWFAAFVLELADLLAEWGEPPPEATRQVDHFVDSIRRGLEKIRTEIAEIDAERGRS